MFNCAVVLSRWSSSLTAIGLGRPMSIASSLRKQAQLDDTTDRAAPVQDANNSNSSSSNHSTQTRNEPATKRYNKPNQAPGNAKFYLREYKSFDQQQSSKLQPRKLQPKPYVSKYSQQPAERHNSKIQSQEEEEISASSKPPFKLKEFPKSTLRKPLVVSLDGSLDPAHKTQYEAILEDLQRCLNKSTSVLPTSRKLMEFRDTCPALFSHFVNDPLCPPVLTKLTKMLPDLTAAEEIFTVIYLSLRFEPTKFPRVQASIEQHAPTLTVSQRLEIMSLLRSPLLYEQTADTATLTTLLGSIRGDLAELKTCKDFTSALRLFSTDSEVLAFIDNRVVQSGECLSCADWIEIVNTMSIIRHRSVAALESCAYRLIEERHTHHMSVEAVQKCLLSCGLLKFHDDQFLRFLTSAMLRELSVNEFNVSWLVKNEQLLLSVINSLSIMRIRNDALMRALGLFLQGKWQRFSNLAIAYLIACGTLYYQPERGVLEQLSANVNEENFDLHQYKEKLHFLNYVWSLCALNETANVKHAIPILLDRSFWSDIIQNTDEKHVKPTLLKLLNVNLYSMLCLDDYQGPQLPPEFNVGELSDIVTSKSSQDTFVSTLSSFRMADKFMRFKVITPYGMMIDSLMIIDAKGSPLPIADFMNEEGQIVTTDNEIKVAFKFMNENQYTLLEKKLNGVQSFQVKLLSDLGYSVIVITKEELHALTLTKRVQLVQEKLKSLVKMINEAKATSTIAKGAAS